MKKNDLIFPIIILCATICFSENPDVLIRHSGEYKKWKTGGEYTFSYENTEYIILKKITKDNGKYTLHFSDGTKIIVSEKYEEWYFSNKAREAYKNEKD